MLWKGIRAEKDLLGVLLFDLSKFSTLRYGKSKYARVRFLTILTLLSHDRHVMKKLVVRVCYLCKELKQKALHEDRGSRL
jgi:hypothetical protein